MEYFSRFWFDLYNVRRRGAWASGASYAKDDLVRFGGVWYIGLSNHTAAETFAIDLAAGKWQEYDLSAGSGSSRMGFQQAGSGAVVRTAQAKMREIVSITDFYANGVSGARVSTMLDCTLGIQAAINSVSSGSMIFVPAVADWYGISDELLFSGKNSMNFVGAGGGTGPQLRWIGTDQPAKAIVKLYRSSYCTIENLYLNAAPDAAQCGYGVRITSGGAGVTQGNTIRSCFINRVSAYGVYIGNTDNLDQSVDLNTVDNCFIDHCGSGSVSIHGSNANLTKITRGSCATGPVCGIEVGTYARGVLIDQVMPYDATTTGLGWLYVRNKFSGQIVVRDCVMEQHNSPFLFTEASVDTEIGRGAIVFENWISTCNFATASVLASYTQHGLLKFLNGYIGGRGDATTTTIEYNTPNIAGPGQRTFAIDGLLTYNNVQILCPSANNETLGAETTWRGSWREQSGPGITASRMRTVSRNDKPIFNAYLAATKADVTGAGTLYTVPFDTVVKNECKCYDAATNRFTAFHDGVYHFDIQVGIADLTVAMTFIQLFLVTSNRTYQRSVQLDAPIAAGRFFMNLSFDADMETNDEAYVQIAVSNGAGNTADVNGSSGAPTNVVTWFSGHQAT